MKAATVKELKTELTERSHQDLLALCLRLSRFKKVNKELLTYLLFESDDEEAFIESIKKEIDLQFTLINTKTYYFIKKSVRKILRMIKKFVRYSQKTETEVELLLYFCTKLKNFKPSYKNNKILTNMYNRETALIKKNIKLLHEDLQYDYNLVLEDLNS
jgi:predicted aldo/keto reductase-like oxidoreductase